MVISGDRESRGALSVLLCVALALFALAAPAARAATPVPLIVDTDMFSDADDAGALATAFGLQLRGEAQVIAVAVNTRTSRGKVATNSWKCVAAITSFYNSGSVPIGTAMPNNGPSTGDGGFAGGCADHGPASPPAPDAAVDVYRRALAGQPDGSVVIASAGFLGNLSALLNSPADAISPLSGRDLIAQKVKTLVAMAGGYPSRSGETNLNGDPASAKDVAAHWPTKLVWSGFEVGAAVTTGQSLSGTHPDSSPVRAAYEDFTGPDTAIQSWDLTAVYHAVRPDDPLLREVGPGTNAITDNGNGTASNAFTKGAGNQYYLQLSSASSLANAIENLLDTFPGHTPPDTTAPAISNINASAVTTTGATVSWQTDEAATTQIDYGTTTAYGSTTPFDSAKTTAHSQHVTGLTASTIYHYRVTSTDAAGNTATSPDSTFTTAAPPDTTAPAIANITAEAVTVTAATISWQTDEAATRQIEYGTTAAYGSTTTLESARATAHSQHLAGLASRTVYHYRVISTDAAGNTATSADFTFTTAEPPQAAPPGEAAPGEPQAPADASPAAVGDAGTPVVAPPRRVSAARCVVPALRGRSLAAARRLLKAHHCALGRIRRARSKPRMRVVRQSAAPRSIRRAGARIDITLR